MTNETQPTSKQIPVTIFTGFLGSGKTTIILNLIDYLQSIGQKVVYIKNELGQEDIDTEIVKAKDIQTQKLLNGFIVHTLVGPFKNAINDLIAKENPDRIIIETAGTEHSADPVSLGIMVNSHPQLIRDGLITVIDVVNFEGYKDLDDYSKDKAKFVDLIVFNKVEMVDQDKKETVVEYVREYNDKAPIVEAPEGKLDPDLAFGFNIPENEKRKSSKVNTFTFVADQIFDQKKLEVAFQKLPKNVIRFKGFVKLSTGDAIINGVFKRFDWLPTATGSKIEQTKIIIIGYQVLQNKDEIEEILLKAEGG